MKKGNKLILLFVSIAFFCSCSTSQFGTKNETTFVELNKSDLELSERKSAEASEVRVLGINFSGIFNRESANFDADGYALRNRVPIIGSSFSITRVQNNALYNLIKTDEDYDFIMYPRFTERTKKVLFFYKKTETKASARLGKL